MVHTELTAVQSHVSDNPGYVDEQIDDLHKALEKAEAAIDKLRDTSQLKVTHRVHDTEPMAYSLTACNGR
jgi:hypothetical protein